MSSLLFRRASAVALCLGLLGASVTPAGAQGAVPAAAATSVGATTAAPAGAPASTPPAPAETTTAPTTPPPSAAAEPAPTPASARKPKWTSEDVARVRAMLMAAQPSAPAPSERAQPAAAKKPALHGDAGAAFALGLSVDAVFHHDRGYDLFAEDDVAPRLGIFAGYDLVQFSHDVVLAAEAGFGVESEDQSGLFNAVLDTELTTTSFFGAASLRYVLFPMLQPQARLSVGASIVDMTLTSVDESRDQDTAVCPFVSLGGGVLFRTPTRALESDDGRFASLSFGVLVEGGYTLASGAHLAMKDVNGGKDIALTQAKLGTLSIGGPYVRTSLVTRF